VLQLLQEMKTGSTTIVDVPKPQISPYSVLIQTAVSLISSGTEKMLVEFGKSSYFGKARRHPEKVKDVLNKIATDGPFATYEAISSKLDRPISLGYCNVGTIVEVGQKVKSLSVGDRVVSNGVHAELVEVGEHLCARVPADVINDQAVFTVVASIGLQGIRLAKPTLGEAFVVLGVGLIGLITVQLLKANGCRVLAIDYDKEKLELAKSFGAEICNLSLNHSPRDCADNFGRGLGVDGVIICASTNSSDPVSQAAGMCRKRGRIVLVGVTGLELNRADFYEKELSFQVSCSYGPGRYDDQYEKLGLDYPRGFVRWTEQRNFEAVLDMISAKRVDFSRLISERFLFEEAATAYDIVCQQKSAVGVLLDYPIKSQGLTHSKVPFVKPMFSGAQLNDQEIDKSNLAVGVIGAGNHSSRVLIPALKKLGVTLQTLVSNKGVSGVVFGRKNGFLEASTDASDVIENPHINAVVIATRHDTHANFVDRALKAGKDVFVEKPLAIDRQGLQQVISTINDVQMVIGRNPVLMVGFNRRFAPHIVKMKRLLETTNSPKVFLMTINAGYVPDNHWTLDKNVGGGRIVGEACHFVDLARHLAGSKVLSFQVEKLRGAQRKGFPPDNVTITLRFEDGSVGNILYLTNGSRAYPKERVEVFVDGKVLQVDNFRTLRGYGWKSFSSDRSILKQDKGQNDCLAAFIESIRSGEEAIPLEEILEVSQLTLDIDEALQ